MVKELTFEPCTIVLSGGEQEASDGECELQQSSDWSETTLDQEHEVEDAERRKNGFQDAS